MEIDFQEEIERSVESLRAYQTKIFALQQELFAAAITVRSKDRSVTVTMGTTCEVKSITFHTDAYRGMPPAELGGLLTDLINKGRGQAQERVGKAMGSLGDFGSLAGAVGSRENSEIDGLMASLRGVMQTEPPVPPQKRKKQEEFHG